MNVKDFLNTVCQEIKYKPVRNEIAEELKAHIQDIKDDYIQRGTTEQQAEEKAVLQMGNAEEIGKKLNKIHRPKLDWKLLILLVILIGFSILVAVLKQPIMNDYYIGKTLLYMIIGIAIGAQIYFFDYKKIKKYSNVIYIFATIIMILPLLFRGMINGVAHLRIFNIAIYTPTIALPLYLISFIGYIVNHNKNNNFNINVLNRKLKINKDSIKIGILSIISLFLMIAVPTFANAVILAISYIIIITAKFIQEKNIKKLIIMYGSIFIIGVLAIICIMASPHSFKRILVSFNPELDPTGSGWVGMLQKEVLDNTKLIGEAEIEILSDKDNYVINTETEYTFIYLLGKTGILVTSLLVLTIILMSIKLIINAKNINEQYGKFLIIGLSTLFILQSFANVLMNLNMWIQSNVNLPFISYGGVNFIINTINIAIILSIYRRKDIYQYEIKNKVKINEN